MNDMVKAGVFNLKEAQEKIKIFANGPMTPEGIRDLSKSKIGTPTTYFYVSNFKGDTIMHPFVESANMWDFQCPETGEYTVRKLVDKNRMGKTIFYYFPNNKGEITYSFDYSEYYEPWDWIISYGGHVEDYYLTKLNDFRKYFLINVIVTLFVGLILTIFFTSNIAKKVSLILFSLSKSKDGDLTTKIDMNSKDEFADISNNYNIMISSQKDMIKDIYEITENLKNSSDLSRVVSEDIKSDSTEQSGSINELTKTLSEITTSINQISQKSSELAVLVNNTSMYTKDAENKMKETISISDVGKNNIEKIRNEMDSTNHSIKELLEIVAHAKTSVVEIKDTVKLIENISEQTNLLALNASIEAARAGEFGRGFSVVADEIRKLAENSARATLNISNMTEKIEKVIFQTIQETEKNVTKITESSNFIEQTKENFDEIFTAISETSLLMSKVSSDISEINSISVDVASVNEEQSASSEEVLATFESINKNAYNLAIKGDEVLSNSKMLYEISEKLNSSINKFKIE
jgi:methyl-accepting chemotaxis protein